MALGMTPTQAYGGTRIQETNQSKNGQCTGTIIDPTGEPVIGATVTVKGKQGGTITYNPQNEMFSHFGTKR